MWRLDNKLITTLIKTFKLFKPPDSIGDVMEYKNTEYLIIGIEKVELSSICLKVWYTCQSLAIEHTTKNTITSDNYVKFHASVEVNELLDRQTQSFHYSRDLIPIGRVFNHDDDYYRWITYTGLDFDYMTLKISALAEQIYPTSQNHARNQLLRHKRKKIGLSLI